MADCHSTRARHCSDGGGGDGRTASTPGPTSATWANYLRRREHGPNAAPLRRARNPGRPCKASQTTILDHPIVECLSLKASPIMRSVVPGIASPDTNEPRSTPAQE